MMKRKPFVSKGNVGSLFGIFMGYFMGKTKSIFMGDSEITQRLHNKNPKKDYSGTWRRVPCDTDGICRNRRTGPKGKAAIKAEKRERHIRGYYGKLRNGEINL